MKIKYFFALLAAGALALTSCSKDDAKGGGGEDGEVSFYLQFSFPEKSKADVAQVQDGTTATFGYGGLFFAKSDGTIVRYVRITEQFATGTVTPAQLEAGHLFSGIDGTATEVHIVGNYDCSEGGTKNSYGDISELDAVILSLLDQVTDENGNVDPNYGVVNATLYGKSPLKTAWSTEAIAAGASHEANVDLIPLIARLEVTGLTGWDNGGTDAEGCVDPEFTLAGIYIDDIYYKSSLIGSLSDLRNLEFDTVNFWLAGKVSPYTEIYTSFSSSAAYADDASTDWYPEYILFDENIGSTTSGSIAPANGAWAYNVYADATYVPHIVFHLTGVKVWDGTQYEYYDNQTSNNPGEAYLTVTNYRENGGGAVSFEGGHIYRLEELVFKAGDLRDEPEEPGDEDDEDGKINVWVKVLLMDRKVVDVEGIFN